MCAECLRTGPRLAKAGEEGERSSGLSLNTRVRCVCSAPSTPSRVESISSRDPDISSISSSGSALESR
jgi:hypothetical protein